MNRARALELPAGVQQDVLKARHLERLTLAYLTLDVVLLYLVMGGSQAVKAVWLQDLLSMIAPIAYLIASRVSTRAPNDSFPYGYHRSISIAHYFAAMALVTFGGYILYGAVTTLLRAEHPTIGSVELFGHLVWRGWLMVPAIAWSIVPALYLGHAKLPLARNLHDKVLHADAIMQKADWMSSAAAVLGVLGIALGFWWADAVAAGLISLDILRDGYVNLRAALTDLMDKAPTTVEQETKDPLRDDVTAWLQELDWVEKVKVRLRDEGQVYFGEAFVVPGDTADLLDKLEEATKGVHKLDWRIYDLVITPVQELPDIDR